jgi:hypothetical protein
MVAVGGIMLDTISVGNSEAYLVLSVGAEVAEEPPPPAEAVFNPLKNG